MPSPAPTRSLPNRKRVLFACVAALIGILAIEGMLNLGWLLLEWSREIRRPSRSSPIRTSRLATHDPELGWRFEPSTRMEDFYGPGRHLTINSEGLRSGSDHGAKLPDRYRVLCLGDSFTMGYGVGDDDSYPAWLSKTNPNVEALNMGMGGYSVGQCWLWHKREGARFGADLVVFALIADDIERMKYGLPETEEHVPKFRLNGTEIAVYNQPVPPPPASFGRSVSPLALLPDLIARRSGIGRAAARVVRGGAAAPARRVDLPEFETLTQVALEIVSDLDAQAQANGGRLAVALLPILDDLEPESPGAKYSMLSMQLAERARSLGIPFRDIRKDYERLSLNQIRALFAAGDLHNNERGNRFVAQAVNTWLEAAIEEYPRSTLDSTGAEPVPTSPAASSR